MPSKPNSSINWESYTQDVMSLYVTQNKTAKETIQYLLEKHSLEVTRHQFHSKFGGLKYVSEKEWITGIIPAIRKRALEGKKSDVYFYGKRLASTKLNKGINRYSARVSRDFMDLDTSEVIGQHLSDRLFIKTPPPHPASQPTSPSPQRDQNAAGMSVPETPAQIPRFASPGSTMSSSPARRNFIFLHESNDLNLFNFDEYPSFPFDIATPPTARVTEAYTREMTGPQTPQHLLHNAIELMSADTLSEPSLRLDPMLDVSQFILLVNLPFFQLKYATLQSFTYSSRIGDQSSSAFRLDIPSINWSFSMPTIPNQPSNDLTSMIARVIGVPCNSQVADFVPSVTKKLQALVPELYPEELNAQVQGLSDSSQKPPIFQLFELAAYFSSNNLLESPQLTTFVDWVITHNHVTCLMSFLRQRWDMLTVQAFVDRLVEAGARMKKKDFLQQLHAIGAKFDQFLGLMMEINDPDFLAFVLRTLDPESLKGEPGGYLLRLVSRTPHIVVAEFIIESGAKINISLSEKIPTTPLWEAIYHGNLDMVKCLIQAGADTNRESAMTTTGFRPAASGALSLAVWKGDKRVVEYLIGLGVVIQGFVHYLPLLEYAAGQSPQIYDLLLEKSGSAAKITTKQVLIAADSDARFFSEFLLQHPEVSERMLEETLVMALRKRKSRAVVNLLEHKVDPNGSHLPKATTCPLLTVVNELPDLPFGCQYVDLLIEFKADVNVEGILDVLACEDLFSSSIINKLVDAGLDLTRHGPAAVEKAIIYDQSPDVWLFLLSKGISVNSYGRTATPFQAAAYKLKLDQLQYLFERDAEVNKPPFAIRGYTALQGASSSWSIEKLEFLLIKGADINAPPALTDGVTALEATVRPWIPFIEDEEQYYLDEDYSKGGDELTETFIYLLDKGAVVNRPNGSSSPLLHDIIERRSIHLLNLALEAGANATYMWATLSSMWCERTPLQLAAEMGQHEAVKLLLSHKADPNAPPAFQHGRTALQAAASSETACIETVKVLLDKGAAVNADPAPIGGITALQGAAIKGYFQIALLLLRNEAKVDAPASIKDGRTAIEGAAEHGRLDMVKMLLNARETGDRETGFTRAISLARKNRHFAVVNLLES